MVVLRWLAAVVLALAVSGCSSSAYVGEAPAPSTPQPPPGAFTARVERIVDGDTFIALRGGQRLRVRLIGVDAPESVRPGSPVECWGPEASRVLQRLLPPGARIRAAYQPGGRQDRFARELWDVWLPDGRFAQAVLVRQGAAIAKAYEPQVQHSEFLAQLEAAARDAERGQFGACPR